MEPRVYKKKLKYLLRYNYKAYTHNTTQLNTTQLNTPTMSYTPTMSSYILVIKRAFGDNKGRNGKMRKGTTNEQVDNVMSQFGTIDRIDSIVKKDHRTDENFKMFFIHYKSLSMDDAYKAALDAGKNLEVDNDDHGHFWLVAKYFPKAATNDDRKKTRAVRIRTAPPPLDLPDIIPPVTTPKPELVSDEVDRQEIALAAAAYE